MKIQEREIRNNGIPIDEIDASNVQFDGLKPPDGFVGLKSELIFGSFVSVKAHIRIKHIQIRHILRKSRQMLAQRLPEKCLNTEFF